LAAFVWLLFLASLGLCILTGADLLYALAFGSICFSAYAYSKGHRGRALLLLLWEGAARLRNVMIILCLIGCMTGLWRACGAIPYIVCRAITWIDPRFFALWSFLLCCLVSLLTGSALCTSSIMGVILMLLARSSGADPLLTGGAVIAGAFFGDRCSPMSSSASLVCAITDTKLYNNICGMLRSALLPFLLTVAGYLILSRMHRPASVDTELSGGLASAFILRWPVVLPCAAILLLSLLRIDVKLTMAVSIGLSVLVGALVQGLGARELLRAAIWGYSGRGAAALFTGGGVLNMLHVACIILLSSTYAGLFRATGLLAGFRRAVDRLSAVLSPYVSAVLVSFPVAAVSCNQNLGIMLTGQLCRSSFPDGGDAALAIEDSVVLTAALIPWNVAAAAPMALMGIGPGCLKYALFLYLLPLLRCIVSIRRHRAGKRAPVGHGYHLK